MKIYADEELALKIQNSFQHLLSKELRLAWSALVSWAQLRSADNWPTAAHVKKFAKLYEVPEWELGALVGFLARKQEGVRAELWTDAVRCEEVLPLHVVKMHSQRQQVLFGLFLMFGDYRDSQRANVLLV